MSRKISQSSLVNVPPPQATMAPAEPPAKTQNGGCILPGYNKPEETRGPVRNRMKSNIFGIDENTKFEGTRSNIGSGGDVDIKYPTAKKETTTHGKPYFDDRAAERLLLQNCLLVNSDRIREGANILIEEGRVIDVRDTPIEVPEETVKLDCSELYCLPGFVDFNTHLQWQSHDPTFGVLKALSQQALKTGTTTIAETLICPSNVCPYELAARFKQAIYGFDNLLWCDFVIRIGLNHLSEVIIDEKLPRIVQELEINSFLFYTTVDESDKVVSGISLDLFERALQKCQELGAVALVRFDNLPMTEAPKSLPDLVKIEMSSCHAVAKLVAKTDCPTVVIGLQTAPAIRYIHNMSNQLPKIPIQCALSADSALSEETSLQPELARTRYLGVVSDQTPLCAPSERALKLWNKLVVGGLTDLPAFVKVSSTEAAKYMGMFPAKGHVTIGADADLVLWRKDSLLSDETSGPSYVIMAGEVVAKDNEIVAQKPGGICFASKSFPTVPYEHVRAIKQFKTRSPHVAPDFGLEDTQNWLTGLGLNDNKTNKTAEESKTDAPAAGGRRGTGRNLFESSFTFAGTEDKAPLRTSIKTHQAPGGGGDTRIW